jgi:chromosome partitioning protein
MDVLVLASRKGGAGKTNFSRHLAVEAEKVGDGPVAIIDADPMGGLSGWWNDRVAETPIFVPTSLEELPDNLTKLEAAGIKLAVIDTPPAEGEVIRKVVRLASLVAIPTRPSPDDLRAVGSTIDIVEQEGRPMVFIINAATRKARLTGQAAITLSQHGTVAEPIIHRYEAFPTSVLGGLTVGELEPGSAPAQEISALWQYLRKRLGRKAMLQASKQDGKPASKKVRKPKERVS